MYIYIDTKLKLSRNLGVTPFIERYHYLLRHHFCSFTQMENDLTKLLSNQKNTTQLMKIKVKKNKIKMKGFSGLFVKLSV